MESAYLTAFLEAYIECAIWSCQDDEGNSFDYRNFQADDLTAVARRLMRLDCREFLNQAFPLLERANVPAAQAGHDFWLTRNRHGAGFWDRGLGEVGAQLTEMAHSYGGSDLYENKGRLELC